MEEYIGKDSEKLMITRIIDSLVEEGINSESISQADGEEFQLFPNLMQALQADPVKDSQRAGEYLLVLPSSAYSWPTDHEWPTMQWTFTVAGLRTRRIYAELVMTFTEVKASFEGMSSMAPRIEYVLNRPESLRSHIRKFFDESNPDGTCCSYCLDPFPTYETALEHELQQHREEFPEILLPPPA